MTRLAYQPVCTLHAGGIAESAPPAVLAANVARRLHEVGLDPAAAVPYLLLLFRRATESEQLLGRRILLLVTSRPGRLGMCRLSPEHRLRPAPGSLCRLGQRRPTLSHAHSNLLSTCYRPKMHAPTVSLSEELPPLRCHFYPQ